MTSSESSPDELNLENVNIESPEAARGGPQPPHMTKDDCIRESSNESHQSAESNRNPLPDSCQSPADLLKGDMLLQAAQTLLEDDLQEHQELFPTVLEPQLSHDLLLNDLEQHNQEILLHDMQPPHKEHHQPQPQKHLHEDFGKPIGDKDGLRTCLSFPVMEGFLEPLQQDLTSVGETSAECSPMASGHLSSSGSYVDITYKPEISTTATAIPSKFTHRFKEKKKSKWLIVILLRTTSIKTISF